MIRNKKGFTLIELIVIIVIIGILAAVAIPRYIDLTTAASDATARGILGGLRSANSLFFASRVVGNTAVAFGWNEIVGSAQIQGVTYVVNAPTFLLTVGANNYVFSISPAAPSTPSNPATIYAGTATW